MQETVVVSCQLHLANKSMQVGAWRGTRWRMDVFERNCKEHKILRCMIVYVNMSVGACTLYETCTKIFHSFRPSHEH